MHGGRGSSSGNQSGQWNYTGWQDTVQDRPTQRRPKSPRAKSAGKTKSPRGRRGRHKEESLAPTGPSLELQAVGQRAIYHAYLFQCASRGSITESGDRAQEARDSHHTRGHRAAHRRDHHTSDHLQECALRCLKGEPSACQIADCATGTTEAPRAMVFLPGAEHCEMERFRGGLQQQGPGLGGKGDLKELHSKQDKAVLESATEVISDGEDDGMKIETAGVIKQGIDSVVTNLENIRVRPAEASKEESAAAKKARIGDSGKASAALQPFARPGNSDLKEICPRPIHNLCFQDHFDLIWKVFTVSLDIIIDAEFGDVSRKPVRDFWLHGIRERAVIGLLAGPPCETWSQARGKTLSFSSISLQRRAPRIVRDRDCLCGRAALALRELEQLHIGNLLLLFTIEMLIHLAVQGGVGAMEHPAPPKDSSLASVWHLFVLQYLCKWPEFLRIELAQGLWGAMSLKPTALLLLNLPAMPKILRG